MNTEELIEKMAILPEGTTIVLKDSGPVLVDAKGNPVLNSRGEEIKLVPIEA
jgi:hypothetical protein